MKFGSRLSLLKIKGDPAKCTDCKACARLCPMDIDIPAYVRTGSRVTSSECTLCNTCTTVCSTGSLAMTFGTDIGLRDRLVFRPPTA
jgi:Pyruvate/2-oxoacid:ferredoxin oxidoreductase delta subunit